MQSEAWSPREVRSLSRAPVNFIDDSIENKQGVRENDVTAHG
jgi:hypothetical protein